MEIGLVEERQVLSGTFCFKVQNRWKEQKILFIFSRTSNEIKN